MKDRDYSTVLWFIVVQLAAIVLCMPSTSKQLTKRQVYAGQIAAALVTYGATPTDAAARAWAAADVLLTAEPK